MELRRCVANADLAMVLLSLDRAATNGVVARYLWHVLNSANTFPRVLPFLEPCNAHGWSLVKGRMVCFKTMASAVHSWSRLMVPSNNVDACEKWF